MYQKILIFIFVLLAHGSQSSKTDGLSEDSLAREFSLGRIFATATLEPKDGSETGGKVFFASNRAGIQIFAVISGGTPGFHGIHIHKGDCSSHHDFSSAGGHFNPTHRPHGGPDPKTHHIGDLGNIAISPNGRGIMSLVIPSSRFHQDFTDWSKLIGKSVILHSDRDDQTTSPAGNAGDRIACGIIKAKLSGHKPRQSYGKHYGPSFQGYIEGH